MSKQKPINPANSPDQPVRCPHCQSLVTKATFNQHLQMHQIQQSPVRALADRIIPGGSRDVFVVCEKCGTRVSRKRLERHMRKVHHIQPAAPEKEPTAEPGIPKKTNEPPNFPARPVQAAPKAQRPANSQAKIVKSVRSKKDSPRRITASPPSASELRTARSIHDNMIGFWPEVNTSTRGGVSLPESGEPALSPAEQMAQDLSQGYVNCPECHKKILKHELITHLSSRHGEKPKKRKLQDRNLGQRKQGKTGRKGGSSISQYKDAEPDGSKNVGHFRRESTGQFGSFPLHDDYGDESNAD